MPTMNGGFTNKDDLHQIGPTLQVQVGLDDNYYSSLMRRPMLPSTLWPALIDTGATNSAIDVELATRLNLPLVDRTQLSGISGPFNADVYLAQVYIPGLNFTLYRDFAGVRLVEGKIPHKVVLGRDFLRNYTLTYNGQTGFVTISND